MCSKKNTDLAAGFESKTCGRCGGSGRHSYCETYGDTCFGCRGKGIVLTKRGIAAKKHFDAKFEVASKEIRVGDTVILCGRKGKVTAAGLGLGGSRYLKDGEWLPYYEIETTTSSLGTFPDATVTRCMPRDDYNAALADSLSYQQTLGVNGKPKKVKVTR